MGTNYALICHGTKRRLDLQGEGSVVDRAEDKTVTAEALARSCNGLWGLQADAALWVQARGEANPVILVSEHEDAYDTEGARP